MSFRRVLYRYLPLTTFPQVGLSGDCLSASIDSLRSSIASRAVALDKQALHKTD
jgi:hypothetical protein